MQTRSSARRAGDRTPIKGEDPKHDLRAQDLKSFRYHHTLDCGHVVRADGHDCAQNCQIDEMTNTVKLSLPFVCYECSGTSGELEVTEGRAKESSPGMMHFLLGNNKASLMDRSKCCGSSGVQYMLRNTRQRRERAPATSSPAKRNACPNHDVAPPAKRAKRPTPSQTLTLAFRPSMGLVAGNLLLKQHRSGTRASKTLLDDFKTPVITAGEERVKRSKRVWTNYGPQSNMNSLMAGMEALDTGNEISSKASDLSSPALDQENIQNFSKKREHADTVNDDPDNKIMDVLDYFPNLYRPESPPPTTKSNFEDDGDFFFDSPRPAMITSTRALSTSDPSPRTSSAEMEVFPVGSERSDAQSWPQYHEHSHTVQTSFQLAYRPRQA